MDVRVIAAVKPFCNFRYFDILVAKFDIIARSRVLRCYFAIKGIHAIITALIFDIHPVIIIAHQVEIIRMPVVKASTITKINFRIFIEKQVGGGTLGPATSAYSSRLLVRRRRLETV